MAIATEFIDFIVPIHIIQEKYFGGWERCLEDHKELIGGRVWYDEHLFRDGAMGPQGIEALVDLWETLGFQCYKEVDGKKHWQDVCVYEGMFGGVTMPCDWLAVDEKTGGVYLVGTQPGVLVGSQRNLKEDS